MIEHNHVTLSLNFEPKVLNNFREIFVSKNSIINVFHHLAILQSLMAAIFFDVASKNL